MATEEKVGQMVGYYAKISVATIRLTDGSLAVGDTVRIRGHTTDFTQPVERLEARSNLLRDSRPGLLTAAQSFEHLISATCSVDRPVGLRLLWYAEVPAKLRQVEFL